MWHSTDDHPRYGIGYDVDEVFNKQFADAQCNHTVYVLQSLLDKSFYKIGYSSTLEDRLQRLESQYAEDQLIEEYMQPLHDAKEDLMNLSVYNPPKSMTLNRYSHS